MRKDNKHHGAHRNSNHQHPSVPPSAAAAGHQKVNRTRARLPTKRKKQRQEALAALISPPEDYERPISIVVTPPEKAMTRNGPGKAKSLGNPSRRGKGNCTPKGKGNLLCDWVKQSVYDAG